MADEGRSCVAHRIRIERARHPPDAVAFERGRRAAGEDSIEIVARGGAEAGVEGRIDLGAFANDDRQRLQIEVDGLAEAELDPAFLDVDVGDLTGWRARRRRSAPRRARLRFRA